MDELIKNVAVLQNQNESTAETARTLEEKRNLRREGILNKLVPLQRRMGFPDNLWAIYGVLPSFNAFVKWGLSKKSDKEVADDWADINVCIDFLMMNREEVQSLFPESSRERIYGIYKDNPLYALFEKIPTSSPTADNYKSLMWTILPLMEELEEDYKNKTGKFGNHHTDICNEFRKLLNPRKMEEAILKLIPVIPLSSIDLYKKISTMPKVHGLNIYVEDDTRPFCVILDMYENLLKIKKPKPKPIIDIVNFVGEIVEPNSQGKKNSNWKGFSRQGSVVHVNHCHFHENIKLSYSKYYELEANDGDDDGGESSDPAMVVDSPFVINMELSEEKIAVYYIENRRERARLNARFAAQAIEKENQNLAIKNSTLSGFEWNLFLNCLQDVSKPVWSFIPEVLRIKTAAWGACRALLARPPGYIHKLMIEAKGLEDATKPETFIWKRDESRVHLSCHSPAHSVPPPSSKMIQVKNWFETEIPEFLQNMLLRTEVVSGSIFEQNYEKFYKALLRNINKCHSVELTALRLENTISDRMAQFSPSDYVTSTYFKGMPPNQLTSAIYTAADSERLQTVYRAVCKDVGRYAEFDLGFAPSGIQRPIFPEKSDYVGSMYVLDFEHVEQTIASLQNRLFTASRQLGASPVYLHNLYTAYLLVFFLSICGVRPNSNLLPFDFDIDFKTGLCFVSEKDTNGYSFSRLVWLPKELLEQMRLYKVHCTALLRFVGAFSMDVASQFDAARSIGSLSLRASVDRAQDVDIAKSGTPFIFFLSEDGQSIKEISPKYMLKFMPPDWEERIYALRHFVRSQLFNQKCSGEIIDPLYGHADFGQAPWTQLSTLNPLQWRQALAHFLSPLLLALKLEALPSPLYPSNSVRKDV